MNLYILLAISIAFFLLSILILFYSSIKRKHKSTQKSIPYSYCYMDGTIETTPGHFTRAYKLEDINFAIAPMEVQKQIYRSFQELLALFPAESEFQIMIQNHRADELETLHNVRFLHTSGSPQLNKIKKEFNGVISDKLAEGKKSINQEKYLIVSIKDNNSRHAKSILDSYDMEISETIKHIASNNELKTEHISIEERLRLLHGIYRQDYGEVFGNRMNEDGLPYLDIGELVREGKSSKDYIAPSSLLFENNYFKVGETYGRTMYLNSIPAYHGAAYMVGLSNLNVEMIISMHYNPMAQHKAAKMVNDQLRNVRGEISEAERHAIRSGYSADLIPDSMEESLAMTKDLLDDITKRDQKLFQVSIIVTVFGSTLHELDESCRIVQKYSEKKMCPLATLIYQQEEGLNSSLPLCVNQIEASRLMTTETAAIFIPYTSQELFQRGGLYYGVNQITNNIIMHNRLAGRNFNGIIFGDSGSGKSFMAKQEMLAALCRSEDNYVYVIDPQGEYGGKMIELTQGEEIVLSTGTKNFLNPLDMDIGYAGEDTNPLAAKVDYIIGLIEMIINNGMELSQKAKSIVDRCVQNIYAGYLKHINDTYPYTGMTMDRKAAPTLQNLYNELNAQPEPEARELASNIEMYAVGSFATFAHRSSVDMDKRYVSFNIQNLGGMKGAGLYICLNEIWNKVIENRKKNRWTWIYIDEFWMLLRSESTAKFLMQIWKVARKLQGVPTGITQNTNDFLVNDTTKNILNNTSFALMMSSSYEDRENFEEWFRIPESQMSYITNAHKGMGLIYTDTTILPFNDKYPKDTILYSVASTSNDT